MSAGAAPTGPSSDHEIRIARTEAGLAALGQDVRDLVGAVRGIADKMEANHSAFFDALSKKGQTNWPLLVSIVVAAMAGIAYLGRGMTDPIVARQEAIVAQVSAIASAVVPRVEVNMMAAAAQRDNDLIRAWIEKSEARVEKRLDRLEGTVTSPAWTAAPTAPVRRP